MNPLDKPTLLFNHSLKGTDIYFVIDVELAMLNGYKFFKSVNNYTLCSGINSLLPPLYFKHVYRKKGEDQLEEIFSNADLPKALAQHHPKYLFILDFEANCIKDEKIEPQEIIEFPVVPVEVASRTILKDKMFHRYVKPEVLALQPFATELCGIT